MWGRSCVPMLVLAMGAVGPSHADELPAAERQAAAAGHTKLKQFVQEHCLACHDKATTTAGLALEEFLSADIARHPQIWEGVVRKLAARQMPPREMPRPDERSYDAVVSFLETELDRAAARNPNPGRTETFRRLNVTEYQNAIRDLLAVEIDAAALLPADESSHGFDNITVTGLSPTLLNRYVAAAQQISRLAVGRASQTPDAATFRVRPDITQDVHIDGLPLGTRGGALFSYHFPQDGEYEIQIRLMRDRNEEIEGLRGSHKLEVLLDRERVGLFTVKPPPKGENDRLLDANLKTRVPVTAGPHDVGATFLKKSAALQESLRQPLNVSFNFYRHPRLAPAVYEISVAGPFNAGGPGDTPSRRRIFTCRPTGPDDEEQCAEQILADLMRRAYRRPIDNDDLKVPMEFFRQGRAEGDFDAGIELALSAVLVNPNFLFRIERDPEWHDSPSRAAAGDGGSGDAVSAGNSSSDSASRDRATRRVAPQSACRISDLELASRLSFFLWSSIPDDELLDLAVRGELHRPDVLESQVRRMLTDTRARSLVSNFAGQWLYLRNLESITPDMRLFPDFDHNLRDAFRRETELCFESILREDRSVLDLLDADATYLNERLAKHYGIPHVYGSRFRRVELDDRSRRGGLLRHGSILTITSYATRTSPVIRGHWVLENLLGAPPPPPPPDVPALEESTVAAHLSVRERLAAHRANTACAVCHDIMDPVGFALENFDAVGRWREKEFGQPIDTSGGLPDGSEFDGVGGLEQALLERPELFVRTLTEKLLTFALGRGVEYYDAPAIRKIVRESREQDYRFSSLILGIVNSTPFQMRMTDRTE